MKRAVVSFPKKRDLLLKFEKTHFARSDRAENPLPVKRDFTQIPLTRTSMQTTTIWQPLKNTKSFYDPFFLIRR